MYYLLSHRRDLDSDASNNTNKTYARVSEIEHTIIVHSYVDMCVIAWGIYMV